MEEIEINYTQDILNDEVFRDIKNISFGYLSNEISPLDVEDDYLLIANDFLIKKYTEMYKLKNAMKLNYYHSPFREIAESMDNITLTSISTKSEEPHILVLTKDISYALDDIAVHRGIIKKIIEEKIELINEIVENELLLSEN